MTNQPEGTDDIMEKLAEHGLGGYDMQTQWVPMNTVSKTAAYTVQGKDKVVLADATGGAFTVTLPAASLRKNAQPITVKRLNAGANAVTIASAGGTIDGAATASLAAQYSTKTFIADGSVWHLIASF